MAVERGWRERVRAGLLALLNLLDTQPSWARLQILGDAPAIVERRRLALAELARALERETRGKLASTGQWAPSSGLLAEMVVGGVFAVAQSRLSEDAGVSLVELAPQLIAFIFGNYQGESAELEHMPVRPTYRTTRVLEAVATAPRSNNREIADAAGLRDEGQMSKLLRRLQGRGLVENLGLGAAHGEPNEWVLTALGERMLAAARRQSPPKRRRPESPRLVGGAA